MSDAPKKLKDLRVADLKLELEKRGLQTSGVKAVLADRLKNCLISEGLDPEEHVFNEDASREDGEKSEEATSEAQAESEDPKEDVDSKEDDEESTENESADNAVPLTTEEETDIKDDEGQNTVAEDEEDETKGDSGVQEEKEMDEDSLNIMVGDEDNLFGEEEKLNGIPGSPPRPETAPVKYQFTSKDTISLCSRSEKPPSENSSMRVNPDESQSVVSHDSNDGMKDVENKSDSHEAEKTKKDAKEAEEKIRNLWVSGLSSTTKAAELKAIFSEHGKVLGAKIVTNSRTVGSRCFGYVTMSTHEDAAKCIEKLNKTELGGNLIIVERATADSGPNRQEKKEDPKKPSDAARTSTSRDPARREDRHHRGLSSHRPNEMHPAHHRSTSSRRDDRPPEFNARGGGLPPFRHGGMVRRDDRHMGGVLTFHQIKDQRNKEMEREEDRRRRERERRRLDEEERRRKDAIRRQREEEERLRREREELKREREKLEREKIELMKFERDRQRMEREKLEREKEELERLRRQQSSRGMDDRRGSKRPADDRDPYMADRKRIGQRDEFTTGIRGGFENNARRTEDRGMSARYDRSTRDIPGGRDMMVPGARNMGGMRDMGGSRGGGGGMGGSRDQGGSRDYGGGSRDMSGPRNSGSSRETVRIVDSRDSGRMGGSDYRGSKVASSHGGSHIGGNSGSRSGAFSGSHGGSSHGVSRGGSHSGGGSSWSGNKSSSSFGGGVGASFNQGSMGDWNRGGGGGGGMGLQNQSRGIPTSGMSLPMGGGGAGGLSPFMSQMASNAFMNPSAGNSMGGSQPADRYDGYSSKSSMINQGRRY